MPQPNVIACSLLPEVRERIDAYVRALMQAAPGIGSHGLSPEEFWDAGIFRSAVERIRGTQAASMEGKRAFSAAVLAYLARNGFISDWSFTGAGERHDYDVRLNSGRVCVVETKGCLDGNNTNIFERPAHADEFVIWSLCQNPGADPAKNAWSGIHTRLGAEIIHRKQRVDGLVIWDQVCGTVGRPCPKLAKDPMSGAIVDGRRLPPPCLYLFPRSIPDPRNNAAPRAWELHQVEFLAALVEAFGVPPGDVARVSIETRMKGAYLERMTRVTRSATIAAESDWTELRRATR